MIELLAKSRPRHGPPLSLLQHGRDTETAARALFRADRRFGRSFCRFFGIEEPERFVVNLCVAALFHDLGKANQDFQDAVAAPGFQAQALRHEHLSALILCHEPIRAWLAQNPALDVDGITAAVLSHHLKAEEPGRQAPYTWCQPRGKSRVTLLLDHPDVTALFERVRAVAGLPPLPALPRAPWSEQPPWEPAWRAGCKSARALRRALAREPARRSLVLALKAGVIAADSVASAMVRTGAPITAWIDDVAHKEALTADKLERDVIGPRCDALARARAQPFELHAFQRRAAHLGPRALLMAGCGSGKTLAAWQWARAQLATHELGHVVFLYPTRGTATEGFRDYVGWAPEAEGTLVHGSSAYELAGMQKNPAESLIGKRVAPGEAEMRLFALGLWSRRYFSATVDQFLAFLDHRYESLCLLPLLADSAVILDEVHSYDRSMFDNLIAFLRAFHGPVLCMTATLPPARRRALEEAGLRVYPDQEDRAHLEDLEAAERHPRYRLEPVAGADEARARALAAYRDGRRVLWVVNTVARCQGLARTLAEELGAPVLAYHSRFRLMDRQRIHRDTVAAFQQRDQPALAVTTQVCEMSLDLDADVLLTEEAPIPSLVQRMGRANRHARPGTATRAAVHVYPAGSPRPYQREDLDVARAFLDELGRGDISQRDLAGALERHSRDERRFDGSARFLDSGYYAVPGSFRDEDDFSVTCVLDSDLPALEAHSASRHELSQHLPGYELSVPRRHVLAEATPPAWLSHRQLAPGSRYDAALGYLAGDQPGDRS